MLAEAPHDGDATHAEATRIRAIQDVAACDTAIEARRSGSLVTRGARG
jgi:hypothetical protein